MDNSSSYSESRFRWVILVVALLAFVSWAFSFQIMPPLIPAIVNEFKISNAEAGLLMSAVLIPGIILSIPVYSFLGRYGVKVSGSIALICVAASAFTSATSYSFVMLIASRLLLGVGGSFILIVAPSTLPQWFHVRDLGKAMGILSISMPLGTILAFPLGSTLAISIGWRYAFYICLALASAATVIFLAIARDGPMSMRNGGSMNMGSFRSSEAWKVGLVWLFFNATILSFNTWAPTLLVTFKGFSAVEAGFYASLLSWMPLPFMPLYGLASDRVGRRKLFILGGAIMACLIEVTMAYSNGLTLVALILALGLFSSMVPGTIQTLPAEILGPEMSSTGFAIMSICMNTGIAATQPLPGIILDTTGSYQLSLLFMAIMAAICASLAFLLKTK